MHKGGFLPSQWHEQLVKLILKPSFLIIRPAKRFVFSVFSLSINPSYPALHLKRKDFMKVLKKINNPGLYLKYGG